MFREESEKKINFERVEIILWFIIGLTIVAYALAEAVNSELGSFITNLFSILILLVLLIKIIKNVKLRNTVRIVNYTILFIIFLSLFFFFPFYVI